MTVVQTILEILKYTIPAIVVLIAAAIIVNKFLVNETQRKRLSIFKENMDTTLRLRLQAYERLALYMERIHPRVLIPRLYETGMTVRDLQSAIVATVNGEFEHNLSQQIYVSAQVWKTVQGVKEQELAMVNQIASQLNAESPARELHQRMIDFILSNENNIPVEVALEVINSEAKLVLTQQG
ncbi:hypothetical protein [Taibaiella chishuiensis]|uniref:Uncharacterized protein n=1 Tax=Taibaiella chishuiensis TaxID=1434707 RepID=A0A2P8CWA8_9BACT|nr:hypothetical protein [Taibaiella chishuiensis]PSK89261.1 hypothetical protein B0I18_11262 [Taibaiella chishuiensis]